MRKTTSWLGLIASTAALVAAGCTSTTTSTNGQVSTAWHWPWSKPAASAMPGMPQTSPNDPTSLANKPPKPGADLYVATAKMYEKTGDLNAAELQYQKALQTTPGHLPALLSYAHLEDGRRQYADADRLYQEAIKRHPKEAAVYNDRGLSYQGRGKLDDAARMFAKAIELQPDKTLYRNNMATALVEMHRNDEAFSQLAAVHGQAVAHYNLATLLHRKGNDREAQYHFAQAAQIDSSLVAAHDWAARLSPATNPTPAAVAASQTDPRLRSAGPRVEEMRLADRRPMIAPQENRPDANRAASNGPVAGAVPAEALVAAAPQGAQGAASQPAAAGPQPTRLPPRPELTAPHEVFAPSPPAIVVPPTPAAQTQSMDLAMRYPQHAPVANSAQGAIPPSPDRLNELPRAAEGIRPLPPLQ